MLDYAKVTSGVWVDYLKDITLVGRVKEDGEFYIFGCRNEYAKEFYKGIYEADKTIGNEGMGFESPEDVEEYWKNPDFIFLTLDKGCYEVISKEEAEREIKKEEKQC